MDKVDKAIESMIKLKETCDRNNLDYKKVPAYKSEKEKIIKIVKDQINATESK